MLIKEKHILDGFLFAVTIVSTVMAVLAASADQQAVFGLSLCLIALIAVGAILRNRFYKRWYARIMFLDPNILEEVAASYYLRPATEADIAHIAEQQAEWYAPTDAIPKAILTEWFKVNPNGFIVICDGKGAPIGHLDLLPIKGQTLELLKRGQIRERDVRGESLHPPSERSMIADLWLESIIVTERNPYLRARVLLGIMRQAEHLLDRLADPESLQNYYAISATHAGNELLSHLGFSKGADAETRLDAHVLHQANSSLVLDRVRRYAKLPVRHVARRRRQPRKASAVTGSETISA